MEIATQSLRSLAMTKWDCTTRLIKEGTLFYIRHKEGIFVTKKKVLLPFVKRENPQVSFHAPRCRDEEYQRESWVFRSCILRETFL